MADSVARGAWHPVALSRDLPVGELRPASVLGEEVVIWRGAEGVHAWQDLCIHRGVRLSLGRVVDNCALRCAVRIMAGLMMKRDNALRCQPILP